jgi:hypothetical protein
VGGAQYAIATTTFIKTLNNYTTEDKSTADLPYEDKRDLSGADPDGLLNMISEVEDENDNGQNDKIPGSFTKDLTTFDIEDDGYIELPIVSDPSTLTKGSLDVDNDGNPIEFTAAQIFKHVISHEIFHGIGADENGNPFCIMNHVSNNWMRDHHICSYGIDQLRVDNLYSVSP